MSIISFEGRSNMFVYRDIKFRVQTILDPSKSPIRINVHAKFSDDSSETRIASKVGSWASEEDAINEAKSLAQLHIDEALNQE